ncbi:MAG: DUF1801 domain-containing protein [Opitutaceae bacterium]
MTTPSAAFRDLLALASPVTRPLCLRLHAVIRTLHPDANELVWLKLHIASFGLGPKKMTEHYAYLSLQSGYVNLGFYRGVALPDPAGLLEGTGKQLRHVKIRELDSTRLQAVESLLRHALSERQQALGTAGTKSKSGRKG